MSGFRYHHHGAVLLADGVYEFAKWPLATAVDRSLPSSPDKPDYEKNQKNKAKSAWPYEPAATA